MTHSGGKPHAVGDRGQRYEIRCTGYPKEAESVIGWGEKADGAMRMAMGILKAPGARTAKVVDRQEKTETEVTR